ncbi:MAG: pyruvate kinase, partial [Deltaproteobacteria bacterium]|nr:pyruvate kinase [Deltaproteobacteria bacterium]
LGPASATLESVRELVRAGARCCRLNFSHDSGARMAARLALVREAARAEGVPVAVLADIQGPKLRIGKMPRAGALLVEGTEFRLSPREVEGDESFAQAVHEHLARDVEPGARILLADGAIELEVDRIEGDDVRCRVVTGGRLFSYKGLNIPGRPVTVDTLTPKDRADLAFLAGTDVDLVAVSFVRSAVDLRLARELLGAARKIPVVAKLERPEALAALDEILDASDGVMVARGDLGVELPFSQVPILQKRVLTRAAERGRFAIVATQMLASMVVSRRPSRAEASDVLNAVLDGADAVMLSEETAVGEHPAEAVRAMAALTRAAEELEPGGQRGRPETLLQSSFAAAGAGAAVEAARRLGGRAIVILAGSGLAALHVSKWRPRVPIVALSSTEATRRRLGLLRGVHPLDIAPRADAEAQIAAADRFLLESGWASPGDVIVTVAAVPLGEGRDVNTIRFHRVRTAGASGTVWPGG